MDIAEKVLTLILIAVIVWECAIVLSRYFKASKEEEK